MALPDLLWGDETIAQWLSNLLEQASSMPNSHLTRGLCLLIPQIVQAPGASSDTHDSEETWWLPSQNPKSSRQLIAQFLMCHTELAPSFLFLCGCASFSPRKPHIYHMMVATGHQQRKEGG